MKEISKILVVALAVFVMVVAAFIGYVFWANRPLPQTEHDVAILERTIELLAEESDWSRNDDRNCEPGEQKLSLYCALEQASIEVAGEMKHRAAALQEVRYAIQRQNPDVEYAHRLMDYNNDPQTSFQDLHAALEDALERLRANQLETAD